MENEKNENANSENGDAGGQQENQATDTQNSATNSDNTELNDLKEKNRQLFERAKKAEGEVKEFRSKIPKENEKPEAKPVESNEPNYGRLAYLKQNDITHPDDIKAVEDEANRLKLPLTDVLGMEHIKTRLQVNKDARTAQSGMPPGSTRAGGATQHDVDYWVQKGTGLPDDQQLAEKVVEARMGKDSSQRKFDPIRL